MKDVFLVVVTCALIQNTMHNKNKLVYKNFMLNRFDIKFTKNLPRCKFWQKNSKHIPCNFWERSVTHVNGIVSAEVQALQACFILVILIYSYLSPKDFLATTCFIIIFLKVQL